MSINNFEYAIVGAGAAGLNLAIKMAKDPFFSEKNILIIDKDPKNVDDRTWSFWEKGVTEWDSLISKKWNFAEFYTSTEQVDLTLGDYFYKTIRSSNFYAHAKSILDQAPNIQWVHDEVVDIQGQEIIGTTRSHTADHIFDSRVPEVFYKEEKNYESLTQHFLGWFIETKTPAFDETKMVMMDYRIKWKDQTSFTYVLPFSPTLALVEFTLFNNEMLSTAEYEEKLKSYISECLQIQDYTIKEVEKGIIPMSNYPFTKHHQKHVSKIGTAGGWVRPSSGYSFKNADRYSQMIVDNIKKGKVPHQGVATSRFRKYDSIFLRVLKDRNDLGEEIFHTLYAKQSSDALFRFLDEESNIFEDAKIMLSLNKKEFRQSLLKTL